MKSKVYHILLKFLNFFVIKSKRRVFAIPHTNGKIDLYDIDNEGSDNVLCVVKRLISEYKDLAITIYLISYSNNERLNYLKNKYSNLGNIKLVFVSSFLCVPSCVKRLLKHMSNLFLMFRSKYWITDTPYAYYPEKVKRQKCICYNYSTPFKSAMEINKKCNFNFIDDYVDTSLLASAIEASDFHVKLEKFRSIGFARNDTILSSKKRENVEKWINSKINFTPKKILVYAPTYRDYPGAYSSNCVFGYEDDNKIYNFLKNNDYLVVVKMHPLQEVEDSAYNDNVIKYEKTFDFSLYDLLNYCDALISDYSSVVHDFIISKKPVILDLFDRNKYDETRGFAFDPIDYIAPGQICDSVDSFLSALRDLTSFSEIDKDYLRVLRMFHKYVDASSTDRNVDVLLKYINQK
ncbi:MAG: hypothetical protein E7178_01820 [Erysipelotrichaceae bacterium]|nr:hypothetical protein [Erysipelotrichaceae bacterium]